MKIQDRRNEEAPDGLTFSQLEPGWTVEGTATGHIYYVVRDPGFEHGKRLVNFNKQVLQNPRYCTGRYRHLPNASVVLGIQPK